MTDVEKVGTTELDKQLEIVKSGRAEAVQEFYDWLHEQGYVLAKYQYAATQACQGIRRDPFDSSNCKDGKVYKTITRVQHYPTRERITLATSGDECPKCGGTGEIEVTYENPPLHQVFINPEQLMADHFGIDRSKIEAERVALLEAIREST